MPSGYTDPLGTIRVINSKPPVRKIKVRMQGRPQDRWMDYARWWWLKHRGAVPAGKRIAHLDGNTLNDSPENLAALAPADVAFLWHERDPQGSERNFAKMKEACAQVNRLRGRIRREQGWLARRWYAVDLERGLIVNRPQRSLWMVLAEAGAEINRENQRRYLAIALGWPGQTSSQAAMLTALAEAAKDGDEEMSGLDLRKKAWEIRRRYNAGRGQISRHGMYSELCGLPQGWVQRRYFQRRRSVYAIGAAALAARGPVCPWVALRGSELGWPPYDSFSKEADYSERPRETQTREVREGMAPEQSSDGRQAATVKRGTPPGSTPGPENFSDWRKHHVVTAN